MLIIPAVLEATTLELIAQIKGVAELPAPHIHIDVMDGKLVESKNELDPLALLAYGATAPLSNLRFELHLMVADPVAEMRRWQALESVFRVLYHREAPGDPLRPISFARKEGWEVGMVLNPDTALTEAAPYLDKIDVLQFMTVYPGRQGAPFVPEVLDKIREFTKQDHPQAPSLKGGVGDPPLSRGGQGGVSRPLCAVDGAVGPTTIKDLRAAGVEIFNVGSFLTRAEDMKQAYEELLLSLQGELA